MPDPSADLSSEAVAFYRRGIHRLQERDIPFLVGGAYAFAPYTGITRHTKDFDLFLREEDLERAMEALSGEGYRTEVTAPHWLGKVRYGDLFIDLIFATGNGVSKVDDAWFERAPEGEALGVPVKLCAPEDVIWTKAFIQERERFDGADVAHLFLSAGPDLDWDVLLELFGPHWRVLLAHLVLFGFIYPSERDRVPRWVMDELTRRLREESARPAPTQRICNGTLLSRAQYLVDVEQKGYSDGRLRADVGLTPEEIEGWTEAIDEEDLPPPAVDEL